MNAEEVVLVVFVTSRKILADDNVNVNVRGDEEEH